MVERSLLFFVGRCANLKLCARKILLCVTEHLCLEIPQKKSNAAYHFSLSATLTDHRADINRHTKIQHHTDRHSRHDNRPYCIFIFPTARKK